MRQLVWIILALLFTGLSVLLVAWPDLKELRRGGNWNVTASEGDRGELDGVTISIDQARAMIFPAMPDRAVLYLRLGLQGDPDQMRDWLMCDLALTDSAGRAWRPFSNAVGMQIIDLLGDQADDYTSCSQSLAMGPAGGGPSMSVQAFLVPISVLNDLRLRISGMTTRPYALSLPLRPVLRPPP